MARPAIRRPALTSGRRLRKVWRGVLFGTGQLVLRRVALAIFPSGLGARGEGRLKSPSAAHVPRTESAVSRPEESDTSWKEGEAEAHAGPGGREKGEARPRSCSLCSFQTRRPSLHKVIFAARPAPTPKPEFPHRNRINIPMAEERAVPRRRRKHAGPARPMQACETERWAERLDLGSGGRPSRPGWVPQSSEKQKEPKEGNGV